MYLCICSSVWFYLLCTVVLFVTTTKQLKQQLTIWGFFGLGLSPCLVGPAALDPAGRACVNKGAHPWSREGIWAFQVSLWLEASFRVCHFKCLLPFNSGTLGTKPLKRGAFKIHTVAPHVYLCSHRHNHAAVPQGNLHVVSFCICTLLDCLCLLGTIDGFIFISGTPRSWIKQHITFRDVPPHSIMPWRSSRAVTYVNNSFLFTAE